MERFHLAERKVVKEFALDDSYRKRRRSMVTTKCSNRYSTRELWTPLLFEERLHWAVESIPCCSSKFSCHCGSMRSEIHEAMACRDVGGTYAGSSQVSSLCCYCCGRYRSHSEDGEKHPSLMSVCGFLFASVPFTTDVDIVA